MNLFFSQKNTLCSELQGALNDSSWKKSTTEKSVGQVLNLSKKFDEILENTRKLFKEVDKEKKSRKIFKITDTHKDLHQILFEISDRIRKECKLGDEIIGKRLHLRCHQLWVASFTTENLASSIFFAGCSTAKQVVDHIIKRQLSKADLENLPKEFPDLTDEDLNKLINGCPKLNMLSIKSDKITDSSIRRLEKLKQLQELSVKGCTGIQGLDLSKVPNLKRFNCDNCLSLKKVILSMKAPVLEYVSCQNCSELETLILPKEAPNLEWLDCLFCKRLTELVLPNMPKLKNLSSWHCSSLTELILPCEAPVLEKVLCFCCFSLKKLVLPKKAPMLKRVGCQHCSELEKLILPEEAPKLEKLDCWGSKRLTELVLPDTPKLKYVGCCNCSSLEKFILLKKAPELTGIHCTGSSLKELDLQNAPVLEWLHCMCCSKLKKLILANEKVKITSNWHANYRQARIPHKISGEVEQYQYVASDSFSNDNFF